MRDAARIGPLLDRLRLTWEARPDLRLGQMVANALNRGRICRIEGEELDEGRLYRVEDEELVSEIEAVHSAPSAIAKVETT